MYALFLSFTSPVHVITVYVVLAVVFRIFLFKVSSLKLLSSLFYLSELVSVSPVPPEVAPAVEEEAPAITKPVSVGVPTLQQDDSGFAVDSSSELKWDVTMNIVSRAVIAPTLSVCPQCDLPVLIYGRMVSRRKGRDGNEQALTTSQCVVDMCGQIPVHIMPHSIEPSSQPASSLSSPHQPAEEVQACVLPQLCQEGRWNLPNVWRGQTRV